MALRVVGIGTLTIIRMAENADWKDFRNVTLGQASPILRGKG
jgi:hypothetical protein